MDCSPRDSPDNYTGVSSHLLLQGIFPTQGSNTSLVSCTGKWVLYHWCHPQPWALGPGRQAQAAQPLAGPLKGPHPAACHPHPQALTSTLPTMAQPRGFRGSGLGGPREGDGPTRSVWTWGLRYLCRDRPASSPGDTSRRMTFHLTHER